MKAADFSACGASRGESGPHTHGSIKDVDEKSIPVHEALVCGGQAEAQAGAHSGGVRGLLFPPPMFWKAM